MNDLKVMEMVKEFPIGDSAKNRAELLSKAEIVAFLARFQEQFEIIENVDDREATVRQYLSDLISLQHEEVIPDLMTAERTLHLASGFIQDFGKVQMIKEAHPSFTGTYDLIAANLELTKEQSKSR